MNLGERIYELRSRAGLSQGELADSLGVSRQAVSKWENNSAVPELDKLLKMSELFGISLDGLVKGDTAQEIKNGYDVKEAAEEIAPAVNTVADVQENGRFPVRKIFALIFFGLTLLTAVLSLALSDIDILTLCVPFAGFGLICWFCKNYTGLNCLWFFYMLFQYYTVFMMGGLNFSIYAIRLMFYDIRYLFMGLGALALASFMIIFTVLKVKSRPLKKPQRAKAGTILRWGAFGLYYAVSLLVGPFLTDSLVISQQEHSKLSAALQILSFADNLLPVILFTAALSFTVRYIKYVKSKKA